MPTIPALTLGQTACPRAFWTLFAVQALDYALRWGCAHWWEDVRVAFRHARGEA